MTNGWPMVPIGQLMSKSDDWIPIQPDSTYREVTVRLWGKGVTLRRECLGADIKSDRRLRVQRGQFILSRIDARNGAFGLIPDELDGGVVSSDFPVLIPNKDRLLNPFLHWLAKTPGFIELCRAASEGTTNRVRLKEDRFLAMPIPLPPIEEQRRIVARIEALAGKVAAAQGLRQQSEGECAALAASTLHNALSQNVPIKKLLDLIAPDTTISYGVLVPGPDVEGGVPFVRIQDLAIDNAPSMPAKSIAPEIDKQYRRTRLHGGELLIGVVGSIGKVGIAPASWSGANIARAVCRIVPSAEVDARYLASVLRGSDCQRYFFETTRTLAQPTLNVRQLEQTPIPLPPLSEQRRIVAYLDALSAEAESLKSLQHQSAAELDALLPSILDRAFKGEL